MSKPSAALAQARYVARMKEHAGRWREVCERAQVSADATPDQLMDQLMHQLIPVVDTKGVAPARKLLVTRARDGMRMKPPRLLLNGLTQGPLVEEWKALSELSQELFGRGAVVNEPTMKIYAAWRDKHTLVEAKRMLYMRRNEPIRDRSTRLERVWSDALVELFRPRRHDDTRDPWFDYLSSRFQLPFNRKCMEVLSGRNERELFPELRDSGASHANGPRQDRGDDDGFGPRDVLRLVGDSQP